MQNEKWRDEEIYRRLCNNTPDLIWSVSKSFRLIAANNAFVFDLKIMTGRELIPGDVLLIPDEFPDEFLVWWMEAYKRALRGEAFKEEVYTGPLYPQEERWMEISFNPVYDDNMVTGIACYARDITQRKQHEEELNRLNTELEQKAKALANSNRELEQFAYVASHDLQEPLRMVSSFLQLLEKKYSDKLDEESTKYINYAVDGANRMKRLVRDLLEYSRAGRNTTELEDTDMNEVAREMMNICHGRIKELGAKIQIAVLPVLPAINKGQMLHLLLNLVNNALNYNKSEKPEIKIACIKQESHWLFSVKDNGIGIEPGSEDKIFVLFQRLHNNNEYPGTGIGLAISKKILENHGGRIWVQPGVKTGSTFYFTLPHQDERLF